MTNDGAGLGMSFDFGPGPKGKSSGGEPARAPSPPKVFAGPSADGPVVEVPPEPLRLLVLAGLRGDPPARDLPPLRVRASTLDEVFAKLSPVLHLEVQDLGGGKRPLEVALTFEARADLRPERLARRAAAALGLRDEPAAAPAPPPSSGGLGGALDSVLAAGAAAKTGNEVLDSIFSMVDMGPSAPAPAPAAAPRSAPARGPGRLAPQVELVLRHPRLRALEAAWRGLELLLARCPREGGVEVELLDVDPAEPEAALVHVVARRHAAADGPPPPSLVLVDASFSRSAADLARLELIAETGEALQTPIVVGLGEAFLGVDLPAFARLDHPAGQLERGLERWTSLRAKPALRWLVGATNGVLLRAGPGDDLLWGHPGWVVLAAAAESVTRTGWPGALTDPAGVDDLTTTEGGGGPLEAALGVDAVEAMAEAGLLALTGPPGRGVARLPRAPTAFRADDGQGAGLPYQLVAGRLAGALLRASDRLRTGSPDQVRARIEAFGRGLVGDTGPGAGAEARLVEEEGRPVVEVELRTGRAVLGGVSLVLAIGL